MITAGSTLLWICRARQPVGKEPIGRTKHGNWGIGSTTCLLQADFATSDWLVSVTRHRLVAGGSAQLCSTEPLPMAAWGFYVSFIM